MDTIKDLHGYNGYPDTYAHAVGYAYARGDQDPDLDLQRDLDSLRHHLGDPNTDCTYCREHGYADTPAGDMLQSPEHGWSGAPLEELILFGLAMFLAGMLAAWWIQS